MRRTSWYLCLLLTLFTSLIAIGITVAQDEWATISVRQVLESGSGIKDVFQDGATAYLYAFSASAGDIVSVDMAQAQDSDLDPFIVLMGPNGEVLASDDDSGSTIEFSSHIEGVELPEDGNYLIMATSYVYIDNILIEIDEAVDDLEDNESYKLAVEGLTAPDAPTLDAQAIEINAAPIAPGDTVEGESTVDQAVGYYVLEGAAGDTVSIEVSSDEFDTMLHVFAPNGDRIAVNDDDPDAGNTNSAIRDLVLPEDGTYLIFATDVFFYNASQPDEMLAFTGGSYTLTVQ